LSAEDTPPNRGFRAIVGAAPLKHQRLNVPSSFSFGFRAIVGAAPLKHGEQHAAKATSWGFRAIVGAAPLKRNCVVN